MADDGRFFGEADPEWAISQLAAQAAAGPMRARRRMSWQIVGGIVVTTGLVAGAFLLGTTHEDDGPDTPSARLGTPTLTTAPSTTPTPTPTAVPVVVAPRVTMAPLPATRPEPTPPRDPAVSTVPTPVAKPAPDEEPDRQSNQVGPNKPIKTPIDPDDR